MCLFALVILLRHPALRSRSTPDACTSQWAPVPAPSCVPPVRYSLAPETYLREVEGRVVLEHQESVVLFNGTGSKIAKSLIDGPMSSREILGSLRAGRCFPESALADIAGCLENLGGK